MIFLKLIPSCSEPICIINCCIQSALNHEYNRCTQIGLGVTVVDSVTAHRVSQHT